MIKSRGKNTALPDPCTHRKGSTLLSPYCHLSIHTFIELSEDAHRFVWTSTPKDYFPQEVFLHSVKGFEEINGCHKEVLMLFLAFFLKLPGCKNHLPVLLFFMKPLGDSRINGSARV